MSGRISKAFMISELLRRELVTAREAEALKREPSRHVTETYQEGIEADARRRVRLESAQSGAAQSTGDNPMPNEKSEAARSKSNKGGEARSKPNRGQDENLHTFTDPTTGESVQGTQREWRETYRDAGYVRESEPAPAEPDGGTPAEPVDDGTEAGDPDPEASPA